MIQWNSTREQDLPYLLALWNDGEVMKYVGFPNGLGIDQDEIEIWFSRLQSKKDRRHFSIYEDDVFVGETFYRVMSDGIAHPDIKIKTSARGKGIAKASLSFCLDTLFANTEATIAVVDPHQDNEKAIQLYTSLGFERGEDTLFEGEVHRLYTISKEAWLQRSK